jgi:mRNA-degrading endonuclease RelE of RelBE toxin-antitoxin system
MPAYTLVQKKSFTQDVARATGADPIFRERIKRRVAKLAENPKHHGYHAGGLIRCNWVAGVGNWAIIYEVNDLGETVVLLRFLSLDEI